MAQKPKLSKSDKDFYRLIGSKGGRSTKRKHRGTDYFAKIAAKSHAARRRNSKKASVSKSAGR